MKRHAFKIEIAGIILMALVIAVPAMAQQHQDQQMMDQQQTQVTGTVIKEKTVDFKGKDQKNQAVLLQTARGERLIADLGDQDKLGQIKLEHGKQLNLQGNMVRVNNQAVLLASQVSVDGQTMQIEQPQIKQRQTDMAAMQEQKQISGKIVREKTVDLAGQDQQYKVIILELQDGENVIADLGPVDQLKMDLKEGEQVDIQGNIARIGNQAVLLASSVSAQGQQAQIQREQQQQQQ